MVRVHTGANPALGRRGARRLASSRCEPRPSRREGNLVLQPQVEGCDRRRNRCKSAQIALDCALRMRMPFRPIRACGLSSLLLRAQKARRRFRQWRSEPCKPAGLWCSHFLSKMTSANPFRRRACCRPPACRPAAARASRVCLAGWLADLSLCVRTSTDVCRLSVTRPRIDM